MVLVEAQALVVLLLLIRVLGLAVARQGLLQQRVITAQLILVVVVVASAPLLQQHMQAVLAVQVTHELLIGVNYGTTLRIS
jgi:hypothetical protein